jgi:hypothetical protein
VYTRTGYDAPPKDEGHTTHDDDPHHAHPMVNRFVNTTLSQQQAALLGSLLASGDSGPRRLLWLLHLL